MPRQALLLHKNRSLPRFKMEETNEKRFSLFREQIEIRSLGKIHFGNGTVYLGRRPATRLKGKCEERLTKDCEDYRIFDLLV